MTLSKNDDTKKPTSATDDTTPATDAPKKRKRRKKTTPKADKTTTSHHTKHASTSKESVWDEKKHTKKEQPAEPQTDTTTDEHIVPGIDDIHAYIARKKATTHKHEKTHEPISFLSPDGTDLLSLPNLYALVPHSKGDHKLVYTTATAPEGLLDDPKKRTPGEMYVKNGRDIYKVVLTMKEHPTLHDNHGEAYDVWIIDTPQQLTEQLAAIKQWMWWGENFGEPILLPEQPQTTPIEPSQIAENTEQSDQQPNTTPDLPKEIEAEIPEETIESSTQATETLPAAIDLPEEGILETTTEIETDEPDTSVSDESLNTDVDTSNLESIDITLPDESTIPDDATDTVSFVSQTPTPSTTQEPETVWDESTISLDDVGTEDAVWAFQSAVQQSPNESIALDSPDIEEPSSLFHDPTQSENAHVSLDLNEPVLQEPETETMHFRSVTEQVPTSTVTDDLPEVTQQEPALFGQHNEQSAENVTENTTEIAPSIQETEVPPTQDNTLDSSNESEQQSASDLQPSQPILSETAPLDTPVSQDGSVDLDSLTIEHPSSTLDLDAMTTNLQNEQPTTEPQTNIPHAHKKTSSSLPIGIIIRAVLFVVIVTALILVWKVMFPTIKWTKAPTDEPTTTWTQQELLTWANEQPTQEPTDEPQPTPDETPPSEEPSDTLPIPDPSSAPQNTLTLVELTEKLKMQQTEARKVLNIAKLLENKQAIKFALAAMLKAGNVLERVSVETTITADDVLQESQKIDRYLEEANKLVE